MSPSAAGPLVPTTRGKDDDRALVPTARVLGFEHSERSRPTFFRSAARGLHAPAARRAASRKARRGSAGPANGRASAAAKSWAAAYGNQFRRNVTRLLYTA